jgi:5'-methylthioadenosine phosphorylase
VDVLGGSLREEPPPGRFVVVDQFVDHTITREKSFFWEGLVELVIFTTWE